MTDHKIGLIFAATTALCWSVLAILLKYALSFADSGTIVWLRMITAWLLLLIYFAYRKPQRLSIFKKLPFLAIVGGLLLGFNYFGYMKGVELTTASHTQILIQVGPLSLVAIGIFYFKETPGLFQWVGMLLAALGFGFFYWEQFNLSLHNLDQLNAGSLWVLAAAFAWAAFAAFQKVLSRNWFPQQLNLVTYTFAALALFVVADFSRLSGFNSGQWALLLLLGVNTLVAYGCLTEALNRAPASHVSLIISLNPMLTIFFIQLLDFLKIDFIAHEPISWRGYIGASFVVAGVSMAVALKPKSKLHKHKAV